MDRKERSTCGCGEVVGGLERETRINRVGHAKWEEMARGFTRRRGREGRDYTSRRESV